MSECFNDQRTSNLFTRSCHHQGLAVTYLTQNLFLSGFQLKKFYLQHVQAHERQPILSTIFG